jgi:hypothetical protein
MQLTRRRWAVLACAAVTSTVLPVAVLAGPASATPTSALPSAPAVEVLSTDADKVSGGDALVQVTVPDAAAEKHLRLEAAGRDVTASLQQVAPGRFLALLEGLPVGESTVTARANGQGKGVPTGRSASATVVNHPLSGPIYSGPQQQPWACQNAAAGLAAATDAACSTPLQVVYRYRTTGGAFAALADPSLRPADLAVLDVDGQQVPYVVRLERGVINRGLYEIAALHDDAAPSPFRAERGLNGALAMTFGGGCNVGYRMGSATAGVLDDTFLRRGYVVASSALLVNDTNCNPVTASETALMVKERVIETYGPLRHTLGWGGSGGAIMQYTIAHGYPGILDGLLPSISFADSLSNAGPPDCALLLQQGFPGAGLTSAQQTAVSGHRNSGACFAWLLSFADRINATTGCPAVVARPLFNPVTAPDGTRCSLADHLVTQLGVADDGYARPGFHNDGVQYGLNTLLAGTITPEQFVAVNERVGGYDRNGVRRPQRTVGDPVAFRRAFETGLVTSGLGGIGQVPTIDLRAYTDDITDIHTSFWSVAIHERLVRDGVDPGVHARWIFRGNRSGEAIDTMEQWLTSLGADTAPGTVEQRIVRNRPAAASDGCWPSAAGPKVEDLQACYAGPFPYAGDPRTVSGGPITTDVGMCQYQPLDRASYGVTFTDAQWARLQAVFPHGVCDYSKPGVGQVPLAGTWQRY